MSSRGLGARVRAHPLAWGIIATAALAGLVVVLVWFQPQALLFDQVVDEDFPTAQPADSRAGDADTTDADTTDADTTDADTTDADTTDPDTTDPDMATTPGEADPPPGEVPPAVDAEPPAEPRALASGSFASRNRYTVTGQATVYELEDGSRTLRLENFESTNGPDLFVYLTVANSADTDPELDADFVNLGVLRGNIGNQNYELPPDVDLTRYDTVAIWCRRFSSGFGAADLAPIM